MSWLTKQLDRITGKGKQEPPVFPYGETQGLIGKAVAEHLPMSAIRDGVIIDINVVVAKPDAGLTEIHLKMRVHDGCVQMMEWPGNAKS